MLAPMAKIQDHKLCVDGEEITTGEWADVLNPYDGSSVGRVPVGDAALVDRAVASAQAAFARDDFPLHERAAVLTRTAELVSERADELARTVALEAGKPLKQARAEIERSVSTFTFSACEARKLSGEVVPMAASAAGTGKVGFMLRVPLGVLGAITPFNFPVNLVAHKLGPAIAAGDPIVLKPSGQTPISALKLAEILFEAGLPRDWLHVVCGSGATVGDRIVTHPQVAAVSFTGSPPVGWEIRAKVPHKRVELELGSNAPLIVESDGDWEVAADKAVVHGFSHAGQSCISTQRILLQEEIADRFTERLLANVGQLKVGDPLDPETDVGPLIDQENRERVKGWIEKAVAGGAQLLTGGEVNSDGTLKPTVLAEPSREREVWSEEIFGPVVIVTRYETFDEALTLANDSKFGLQAGVFTRDIGKGLLAAHGLDYGGVLINEVPTFRADQQPYGGVKDSGNTREGPAYAIRELTEERFVTLQG